MRNWMKRLAAGAVAGIAALNAAPAGAAPLVYATVTGTVLDDGQAVDNLGFFAVPGSSLAGAAFAINVVYDLGQSNFQGTINSSTADYRWTSGVSGVLGSITINGRSLSFDSTGFATGGSILIHDEAGGTTDQGRFTLFGNYNGQQLAAGLEIDVRSVVDDFITSPVDLTSPFTYAYTTGPDTQVASGTLNISDNSSGVVEGVFASFDIDAISVSSTGSPITAPFITEAPRLTDDPVAAPEPATLALIGIGLTALGFARRRRFTF